MLQVGRSSAPFSPAHARLSAFAAIVALVSAELGDAQVYRLVAHHLVFVSAQTKSQFALYATSGGVCNSRDLSEAAGQWLSMSRCDEVMSV